MNWRNRQSTPKKAKATTRESPRAIGVDVPDNSISLYTGAGYSPAPFLFQSFAINSLGAENVPRSYCSIADRFPAPGPRADILDGPRTRTRKSGSVNSAE